VPSGLILFTNYLAVWWAGAAVAEKPELMTHKLWMLAGLALILAGFAVLQPYRMLAFQLCGLGFAALLSGTTRMKSLVQVFSPVVFLGRFSYSLYLVHIPVLVVIVSAIYGGVHPSLIFPALGGVLAAILTAYVFYLLVERSSQRIASGGRSKSLTQAEAVRT